MEPTIRQLHAFVLAYRAGVLTRAAEQMFITQSAVSALIAQLEEALGVKLFDRTTRALRPTSAATDLLPTAERVLRDIEAVKAGARGIADRTRGYLSFASTPSVAAAILPSLISEYESRYPNIRIALHDMPPDRLVQPVVYEEVEFSIGTLAAAPDGIVLQRLLQDNLSAICRADSALAQKPSVRWSDVVNHRCITVKVGQGVRELIDETTRQLGLVFEPAFEVSYLSTALALASAGLGVAVLPGALLGASGNPNLVARKLEQPVVTRDIYLISRAQRSLSPAAAAFVELWHELVSPPA